MAPLRLWEQICSSMAVTYGFELKGKLDEAQLKEAWKLVQKELPYARTVIRIVTGEIAFVEDAQPMALETTVGKTLPDTNEEVVKSANTPRDHGQGTFFFKLFSDETATKHLLVVTMNHAGADANSGFRILQTLFAHVGNLSAGKPALEGAAKATADVLGGLPAKFAAPALKLPAAHMPPLPALGGASGTSGTEALLSALSPEATTQLILLCKARKISVQGAVTAATMIAQAAAQTAKNPLPQTMIMQCPVDVRKQVDPPVPTEAVAAGCSLLWWPQQLAAADRLWDVAAAASAAVRRERDAKGGLAFWTRLHANKTMTELAALPEQPFLPPFTANSTTLGVIPLLPQHGQLRIASAHVMLSAYGAASPDEAGTYFLAHTFDGRLHTTFTYSMPAVGHARGKALAATHLAVLKVLASDAGDKATVADFLGGAGGLGGLSITA